MYTYIYRERERDVYTHTYIRLYLYIYIYVYTYIYIYTHTHVYSMIDLLLIDIVITSSVRAEAGAHALTRRPGGPGVMHYDSFVQ